MTLASPARRWKNDCRTCQPTTARRCSITCSRTSQPLRTLNERVTCAVPERGVPAEAHRDAERRERDPRDQDPPPAGRDRGNGPDGAHQQAGRHGAHDLPPAGRRWMSGERAGVVDQPAGERPGRGAGPERQELAASGGVAEPGDQGS